MTIGRDPAVTINSVAVEFAHLGVCLAEILRTRAQRAVFVQHVAWAIDIAKGAGIGRIGLLEAASHD